MNLSRCIPLWYYFFYCLCMSRDGQAHLEHPFKHSRSALIFSRVCHCISFWLFPAYLTTLTLSKHVRTHNRTQAPGSLQDISTVYCCFLFDLKIHKQGRLRSGEPNYVCWLFFYISRLLMILKNILKHHEQNPPSHHMLL